MRNHGPPLGAPNLALQPSTTTFPLPPLPTLTNLFPLLCGTFALLNTSHVIAFIRLSPASGLSVNSHFRRVSNPSRILHSLAQPFLLVFPPKFSNLNHHPSFFPICLGSPHPDGMMSQSQLPKLFEIREVCGGHGSHCGLSLSLILIYIIPYLFKHLPSASDNAVC